MRRRALPLLAAAAALAGCDGQSPPDIAVSEAERFLAAPLPPGARGARAAGERGIDTLVLLRFDAPPDAARAWAERVTEGGRPDPGELRPEGVLEMGRAVPWWPRGAAPGASARGVFRPDNRAVRVLVEPRPDGSARVLVAAFST